MAVNTSKSLVADYDSSSSEETEASCIKSSSDKTHAAPLVSALEMLDQTAANSSNSVFANPYREAEHYEQAVLEKHVKMTTVKEIELNKSKRICFKFHKGKCKLGEKCHFVHHNPLHFNDMEANLSDPEDSTIINCKDKKLKKRCGLKNDLIPPKKYLKDYKRFKS